MTTLFQHSLTHDQVAAVRERLSELLAQCVTSGASDLHLSVDRPPYFRVHGELKPDSNSPVFTEQELEALAGVLSENMKYLGVRVDRLTRRCFEF